MPKLDGEQVYRELRKIDTGVKVVLCSGFTEQDATHRLAGQGLAGFLQKPYDMDQLRSLMQQVLGRPSAA